MPTAAERIAVRFGEAIDFLSDLLGVSEREWLALVAGAGIQSRAIADELAEAVRKDLLSAVLDVMESGGTLADFRQRYAAIVAERGWLTDGDPGWHSELVFRVQVANAQAAGRWAQIQPVKAFRPYLRYVTAGDRRVRLEHREWHDVVLPVDHPFWQTHYPPNGFQCRCTVQSLSERDLARYRLKVTPDDDPALTIPPDKGWNGNVGVAWEQLRSAS